MAHLSRLCCFSFLALFITLNIQALVMNSDFVGTKSVISVVMIVRIRNESELCSLSLWPCSTVWKAVLYMRSHLCRTERSGQIWVSPNYTCSFYPANNMHQCTDRYLGQSSEGEIDFHRHHQSLPGESQEAVWPRSEGKTTFPSFFSLSSA